MDLAQIRLVVFDVDGVLVPIKSSWEYVHRKLGTTDIARRNYELFSKGLIGYWEWMYLDTLAWIEAKPGITVWDLERILSDVDVLPEAYCAVKLLRRNGIELALISGGLDLLVSKVASRLNIKYWFSPRLAFDPWGKLVPGGYPEVEADRKDKVIRLLGSVLGIPLRNIAFIGDSRWDARAMKEVGLAIAVNTTDPYIINIADAVAEDVCEAAKIILKY
ncbi:MAG: HAD-IB family phosphatase [Pyrodictiaceae archaeon]